MIVCLIAIVFFATIATGPAGLEWAERRRARHDQPKARVVYLPSAVCRPDEMSGRCISETCAVCAATGRA